jgi:hypothetical protein
MTPQEAYNKRHAHLSTAGTTFDWDNAPKHVQEDWLAAWTIADAMARHDERNACAELCEEWARICDSGKRHGAKVGAQECAKLIRTQHDTEGE